MYPGYIGIPTNCKSEFIIYRTVRVDLVKHSPLVKNMQAIAAATVRVGARAARLAPRAARMVRSLEHVAAQPILHPAPDFLFAFGNMFIVLLSSSLSLSLSPSLYLSLFYFFLCFQVFTPDLHGTLHPYPVSTMKMEPMWRAARSCMPLGRVGVCDRERDEGERRVNVGA